MQKKDPWLAIRIGGIKSKQVKRLQFNRRGYKSVAMHGHAFLE